MTYRLTETASLATYACHCLQCQTWSGSAFAEHALLMADDLQLDGVTVSFKHEGPEQRSAQIVCGRCHTRIYNTNSAVPGMIVLRVGTLDASDQQTPVAHIWVKRKQPWIIIPDGVPVWEETPTPYEFAMALQKAAG